jgi:hypothetical protein
MATSGNVEVNANMLLKEYGLDGFLPVEGSVAMPLSAWVDPYSLSAMSMESSGNMGAIARGAIAAPPGTRGFKPFLKDDMDRVLVVKVPGKESLDADAAFLSKVQQSNAARRIVKAKKPKVKGQKRAAGAQYVVLTDTASTAMYAQEGEAAMPRLEADAVLAAKRAFLDRPAAEAAVAAAAGPSLEARCPSNLQEILLEIFTTFWEMDFDRECSDAFFSIITPKSCARIGLGDYFDKFPHLTQAFTMPFMKEKLDAKRYPSSVEFSYDFRQMCDHVVAYYPAGSGPSTKAAELKKLFETQWDAAQERFVYT